MKMNELFFIFFPWRAGEGISHYSSTSNSSKSEKEKKKNLSTRTWKQIYALRRQMTFIGPEWCNDMALIAVGSEDFFFLKKKRQ